MVSDALTHEVNFPAWNIDTKKPAFFSKIAATQFSKDEYDKPSMYTVSFRDMIWASSVNPSFFAAANLTWEGTESNVFFGGETVASCPALYSHYLAH